MQLYETLVRVGKITRVEMTGDGCVCLVINSHYVDPDTGKTVDERGGSQRVTIKEGGELPASLDAAYAAAVTAFWDSRRKKVDA